MLIDITLGIILGIMSSIAIYFILQFFKKKHVNESFGRLDCRIAEKIVHSVPDSIFVIDKQGKIQKILNYELKKTLLPEQSLVGMCLQDYVDIEYKEQIRRVIKNTFISDEAIQFAYSVSLNGVINYFESQFVRIESDCIVCFERNISELRKAKAAVWQSKMQISEFLDYIPVAISVKDVNADFRYIYWNKKSEKESRKSRDEVIGKTDAELYGEEKESEYRAMDKKALQNEKGYCSWKDLAISGERVDASVINKSCVSNAVRKWIITTYQDVSDFIKNQKQMEETNKQLQIVFSATSSLPLLWDVSRDMIYFSFSEANKGVSKKRIMTTAEALSFIHPNERMEVQLLLDESQKGKTEQIKKRIRCYSHDKFIGYYDVCLVVEKRDQEGKPVRFIGAMRNVTEQVLHENSLLEARRNIEKIQRKAQLILDNTNSGLIYLNSDCVVEWENVTQYGQKKFPLLSGCKSAMHCYRTVGIEMQQTQPCKEDCIVRQVIRTGKAMQEEIYAGERIFEVIATPVVDDDRRAGVVLKYEDVTVQRKSAGDLKRAKEEAEASNKLKTMFLSNMGHELRTPLNSVVEFSKLLVTTENAKEKKEFASIIKRNNEMLLQLINDILDLSKIEAGMLEFTYSYVDVNELFRNMELNARVKAKENVNLEIKCVLQQGDCVIQSDRNRIQQVMMNMIDNALKFTEKGVIEIGYEVQENKGVRFYVSDTGQGISQEKQKEVFGRFVKLNHVVTGTGLGLSICEMIVQKLGGRIGVESEEGKGTTFWFTLPVILVEKDPFVNLLNNQEEKEQEMESSFSLTSSKRPVILIAEDTADNFRLYQVLLGKKYHLLHAWNGKDVVEIFKEHESEISVIIMDIRMPVMDGYKAMEIIREINQHVPIIAVSACALSEEVNRIINSGFNSHIFKPIDRDVLLNTLDSYIT